MIRALALHDVQDVRQASPLAVCLNTGPRCRRAAELEGVGAADVVRLDLAVAVHLDAVVDGVAVGRLAGGQQHRGDDAGGRWRGDSVGLDQVQA